MGSFGKFAILIGIFSIFMKNCASYTPDRIDIAGNLSLPDCIRGNRPTDSEDYITTSDFVKRAGYKINEHMVVTDDGYILTLHRIPGKSRNAPPVFLQHGFTLSSFDWVVSGKEKAIAFILADHGYDVWMGNARGNTYSRCHTRYTTEDPEFWDFSFHEMGVYDLPAAITYVNKVTNQRIFYVGHSMGTTMFYVMAIERPDVAVMIKAKFGFTGAAYMDHMRSLLRMLAPLASKMEIKYPEVMGTFELLSHATHKEFLKNFCIATEQRLNFCAYFISYFLGPNSKQFNNTLLPSILTNAPAGTSFKVVLHYAQEMNAKKFQYYDYGSTENLKEYGSPVPPEYDISKIRVPVGIFWSDNDLMVDPVDVQRLYEELPNKIFSHRIEDPSFNHVDYIYGIDTPRLLYSKLLSEMEKYK